MSQVQSSTHKFGTDRWRFLSAPHGPLGRWSAREFLRRGCLRSVPLLMVAILVGCGEDEIRHYKAARVEQFKPPTKSRAPQIEQRLLAAIIPHGDRTWFFKLVGPVASVNEQSETFDQFIRSVRFEAGKEIDWTVPEGWKQQPGSAMRFATFQIETKRQPIELSVSNAGGSILANVNRWRGQLGLEPVGESELGTISHELKLDNFTATIVDMTVAGEEMPPGHPPVSARMSQPPTQQPSLNYTIPDGWKEVPAQSKFRVASFEVSGAGKRADVSISPLSGNAGGLLANVNRWRHDQLGLPEINEGQLRESLRQIDVAGSPAHYVELIGPESAGENRQSILGVMLERGAQTWFFKMTGAADLVAQQKSAFEEFVRSIKFE